MEIESNKLLDGQLSTTWIYWCSLHLPPRRIEELMMAKHTQAEDDLLVDLEDVHVFETFLAG